MKVEIKVIDEAQRQEKLDALSLIISKKRDEAVRARKDSGIEKIWMQCEEAYVGIDDANRHEYKDAKWAKPTSMAGPLQSEDMYKGKDESRSTVYIPLTRRYVDAGAAKLGEILLPIDDKAFSFSATPIPDPVMQEMAAGISQIAGAAAQVAGQPPVPPQMPQPAAAPVQPPMMAQMGGPGGAMPQPVPPSPEEQQNAMQEQMQDRAERAEKRIYDWMVEANYQGENRKVIFDSARIGVGVLKGPFPDERQKIATKKLPQGVVIEFKREVKPSYKWVDAWNFYPDGACGEDIHNGDHCLELDYLSESRLRNLKKQPGYIKSQINKVIKQGPEGTEAEEDQDNPNSTLNNKARQKLYKVWHFYGSITRKELLESGLMQDEEMPEGEDIYVIVTMANSTILRAVVNPLDSGSYPYHVMPWSRRAGNWAGIGVGEQVNTAQRMLNAATRAWMNNAGNSCGPQIIIDRGAITPAQANSWMIHPNKVWFKEPDSQIPDVRAAFMTIDIPNVGASMLQIIEYAFKLAEESTSIPLVTQGQTGPTTPETLGATQLQYSNANTLLRSIGYTYDESLTEPVVRQSYEWMLLDPNVPDDEKGDWEINARGSAAMVERAIQDATLAQAVAMSLNPAYGVNPEKAFAEFMKSKRIDPRKLEYTEAEKEQRAQMPPPEAPQVTAAKINAESRLQIEQMKLQGEQAGAGGEVQVQDSSLQVAQIRAETELRKAQMSEQAAMAEIQAKSAEAERQRQHELQMRQIDLQIENMRLQMKQMELDKKIAADQQARVDEAKVDLAKTKIDDNTKRELAEQETQLAVVLDESAKDHDVQMNPPSLIRDEMSTNATP